MHWTVYGPNALLVQFATRIDEDSFARACGIIAELQQKPPPGLQDYLPAFTTLLLEFDPRIVPDPAAIAPELINRLSKIKGDKPGGVGKKIAIRYDGPDLARVAEHNRITVDHVKKIHSATLYRVYLLGFSPGFPYLGLLDRRLHTPRLPTPRPIIPAGSVGIGGEHTGIYSVPSPGGWNIIGHTPDVIFDPQKIEHGGSENEMFFLHPGDRVQFVDMDVS
jgi:KipI family sensor histidine kinase inhibitor